MRPPKIAWRSHLGGPRLLSKSQMKPVHPYDPSSNAASTRPPLAPSPSGSLRQPKRRFEIDEKETYRRLALAIRCVCPRWLAPQSEDLAQRAALKILEQHTKGNIVEPMCSTYLNRVAMSVVIDEIRYRRRRPQHEGAQLHQAQSDEPKPPLEQLQCKDTPETQSSNQSLGRAILGCVSRLGKDRKLAVTLGLQGYSVKEIAQTFDWSAKKAKNLYFRGRNDLQTCLRHKGFDLRAE